MRGTTLQITAHDAIVVRDGRPFGIGQGNRMRSLPWPLPSVIAGALRTALVEADRNLTFQGDMPQRLMSIAVYGVFPCVGADLFLPAASDCLWQGNNAQVFALKPVDPLGHGGADFPSSGLRPVMLTPDQSKDDFKPAAVPAWWPMRKMADWLLGTPLAFDRQFLNAPTKEVRDHVHLDSDTGAAYEGHLFTTSGLCMSHLPRYGAREAGSFEERFAQIRLVTRANAANGTFQFIERMCSWHPLGGERRLVHWRKYVDGGLWECPETVRAELGNAQRIRMVLATPAIFTHGWRPGWLDERLEGKPINAGPKLRLVGVCNSRWKAVSGWSLAHQQSPASPPRGPKPIRRMVPAGSVYFFEKIDGEGSVLAQEGWLEPVSDSAKDRIDGFGLAIWGIW